MPIYGNGYIYIKGEHHENRQKNKHNDDGHVNSLSGQRSLS